MSRFCGTGLMHLNGIDIYLSRKRIKNINLRINREGQVKVSAPMTCSLSSVQKFLQEKQDWIIHHRNQLLNKKLNRQPQLLTGESLMVLGKPYTIVIHENANTQGVVLDGDKISCYLKDPATPQRKHLLLQQWHKTQMRALIPELLHVWEQIIGVKVHQWGIKAMKTRWGSCHPIKKRIWLNLHLIYYPLSCLEYVIAHELVHLLEASHNKRFYRLMSQFMPDWQARRQLLS